MERSSSVIKFSQEFEEQFERLTSKIKEMEDVLSEMAELGKPALSYERKNYIIASRDYIRGTKKELDYVRKYKALILRLFQHRCAACLSDQMIELDHGFVPKSRGGCFRLQHFSGFSVNNLLPLCERCNRQKQDKDYKEFFSKARLEVIFKVNHGINLQINKDDGTRFPF